MLAASQANVVLIPSINFSSIDFSNNVPFYTRLLGEFNCENEYNSSNPFDFMEMISLEGKTNFFEKRVSEYQKAGVKSGGTGSISFDADF